MGIQPEKVKLCYAPISQKDQSWRKTVELLKKDKACLQKIVARPYTASNNSFTWTAERDAPSRVYFVRAFALDAHEEEVAYRQTPMLIKLTTCLRSKQSQVAMCHLILHLSAFCFLHSLISLFLLHGGEESKDFPKEMRYFSAYLNTEKKNPSLN